MSLHTLILVALKSSIVLFVFSLGLEARPQDTISLFRRPAQLLRSLVSMNLVMPLFAAAMVAGFRLHPAVEIALVALALSPVPPLLPKKSAKSGGDASYMLGLLVAAGLLSVLIAPIGLEFLGHAFRIPVSVSPWKVAALVAMTILAPLAAGILVHHLAPSPAERLARPAGILALLLLVVCMLPVLFVERHAIASVLGNGTLLAITAFVVVGLTTGYLIGGPTPGERTVLALATATRHPGVAMTIAAAAFPEERLVPAAIVVYLLTSAIITVPYLKLRQRRDKAREPKPDRPDEVGSEKSPQIRG